MGRDLKLAELWRSSEPMMSLRDPRHSVLLRGTVAADGGPPLEARVRNLSRGGAMAECRFPGNEGDRVEISMRGLGEFSGSIAWTRQDRIGVVFDEPIDPGKILKRPSRGRPESCMPRPVLRPWRPALHCS